MSRQAINIGFPNPNYVSETGPRDAILPGIYEVESVPTSLVVDAGVAVAYSSAQAADRNAATEWAASAERADIFIASETLSAALNHAVVASEFIVRILNDEPTPSESSSAILRDSAVPVEASGSTTTTDVFLAYETLSAARSDRTVPIEFGALLLSEARVPFEMRMAVRHLRPYLMINI